MSRAGAPRRIRPRLLPVVITAGAGLLLLKVLGLATQGNYQLPAGSSERREFGRALTGPRSPVITEGQRWVAGEGDVTGSVPPKDKDAAAGKAGGKPADKAADKGAAKAPEQPESTQPMPPQARIAPAERAVLEKLGERRQHLEDRARELDMRENLIRSAEKLVDDRLEELKALEARQDAGKKARQDGGAMKSLVVMYEAMKPRDAARVFEKMDQRMLAPLARQMNPRKLSEVLALMSAEAAEKLTASLMRPEDERAAPAAGPAPAQPAIEELPRVSPDGSARKN